MPPLERSLGDVPPDEMRRHLHDLAEWVADYREHVETRRISPRVVPGAISGAARTQLTDEGEPMATILADLDAVVLPGVVHWGHPAFLGYFGSTSNGPALLGEIAAAALNVSAMTWKTSPAATELETVVLAWIRDLVGFPASYFGVVYDTASVAIVHALAAARERAIGDTRAKGVIGRADVHVQRVYASEQAHSSIEKALLMLGLGAENLIRIPTDDAFRMDVAALRARMAADAAVGLHAMAVVATIGTTSTASVDPVAAIAEECERHRAWLHVDAAYGGAIGALEESRAALDGIDRADSIVVNPHKWLFVPLDFSVLYLRKPEELRALFVNTPEYLEGDTVGNGVINYMDYGIQLGRRFRALKAWMVLRAFGRDGITARIREHCRLAARFAEHVRRADGFEVTAPPSMAVVCFRYESAGVSPDAADEVNRRIVDSVNTSGDAYLTHTRLHGRVSMRVGIGNVLTTERHIDAVWSRVLHESRAHC